MPGVAVRDSPIEGLGVFARQRFEPGDEVRQFHLLREVTPESPIRSDRGERQEHCTYIDRRVFLVGPPDCHFNHSCDPNAYKQFTEHGIRVLARRRIEAETEITLDYLINTSGGDRWPCNCGASRCRGRSVSSFFELPIPIQLEYLPLLAPWFTELHPERVRALEREAARAGTS